MSTLILEPLDYSEKAISLYSKLGEVYLDFEEVELSTVEVLVVRLNYKIDEKICDQLKNLKFIATPTTGLNHLDMDYLSQRGIKVISLRDTPTEIRAISSTTEITVWHIVNIVRQTSSAALAVKSKNEWRRDDYRSRQLSNMTLGIVGMGRIGSQVAKVCSALGMDVCFYDPYLDFKNRVEKHKKYEAVDMLHKLLALCDIVSVHVPLNAETENLFCEKIIQTMRSDSYLVNTSRGEIVDENAIANAIREKRIAGYACDVLRDEQTLPIEENVLVKQAKISENVQITPHIGGCTADAMHLTEEIIAQKLTQFITGETFRNRIS